MRGIKDLGDYYGFKIIEDASHAIGARYEDTQIGSCEFSDITVFSFHPVKIITSGEGGAALTNDPELGSKINLFRSHGVTRDTDLMQNSNSNDWYYEQIELGFNYRMTDIQAALGLSQLERIDKYIEKRQEIAKVYDFELINNEIILPLRNKKSFSSVHLYVIQVDGNVRDDIFKLLRENGIGVNVHYIPVHTQPYYQKLGFNWGDFPNAETYSRRAISLPVYPALSRDNQSFVIETIKQFYDA